MFNQKLQTALKKVPGAYPDFVYGVCLAVRDDKETADKLMQFIYDNPTANDCEISEKFNEYRGIFPIE